MTIQETPFADAVVEGPTDLVVVDPNRAGLRPQGVASALAMGAERILYVACSLEALARDLGGLGMYRLTAVRLADLFPHTEHVEVLALLQRG